jgi:O-antigen chain-terminating methyltransferase
VVAVTQSIEAAYRTSEPTMNRSPMQTSDLNHPVSIASFLAFHDDEFIHHAYQCVLGRNPDSDGLPHYLTLLRQGESKIEILGRLRYSREGRQLKVKIPGLLLAFGLQRAYRLPLLGRLLHIISCAYHLPDIERAQRSFENFAVRTCRDISAKQQNLNSNLITALRQINTVWPDTTNPQFNGSASEIVRRSENPILEMTIDVTDQHLTPNARHVLAELRRAMTRE